MPADAGAFTSPVLDLQLKTTLLTADRWEGRGFAFAIADDLPSQQIVPTALHEFCHRLDTPTELLAPFESLSRHRRWIGSWLKAIAQRPHVWEAAALSTRRETRPPWHQHDAAYIRFALHVQERAWRAGYIFNGDQLHVAGERYGLTCLALYGLCLGDEPRRWLGRPLRALPKRYPKKFANTWRMDTGECLPIE